MDALGYLRVSVSDRVAIKARILAAVIQILF